MLNVMPTKAAPRRSHAEIEQKDLFALLAAAGLSVLGWNMGTWTVEKVFNMIVGRREALNNEIFDLENQLASKREQLAALDEAEREAQNMDNAP